MVTQSKLAVILHADVVGSTALVQKDERIAHERIQTAFRHSSDTISAYGGTTRELRGDALVAEFERASDAVAAALAFQASNTEHNESLDDDVRPSIRVGVALGEVIIADRTVTGAGVVLAQRLEQLADPGGINISAAIREALPARLPLTFVDLGEHELKGFDVPQRCYRVALSEGSEVPGPETSGTNLGAEAVQQSSTRTSIAVLPFDNLSTDPEQEYFADGIAEDLITALSRYRWFFVIARNSSFAYKGQAVDVKRVAEELGVQYVVEGSVRRAGSRVRIAAQLIEAQSGNHVWAERYDRELIDIFELQDEITAAITGELEPELATFESGRAHQASPGHLTAWDQYLRGMWHLWRFTKQDSTEAQHCLMSALEHEPGFAPALGLLAYLLALDVLQGLASEPQIARSRALEYGRRAVVSDPRDPIAHHGLGRALAINGDREGAIVELQKCVELNPSFAQGHFSLAGRLTYADRASEAIPHLERAMSLSPHDPNMWGFLVVTAGAHLQLREFELSAHWAEKSSRSNPDQFWPHLIRAAALGHLGRIVAAQDALATARVLNPDVSLDQLRGQLDDSSDSWWHTFAQGLALAGFSEQR
jgi:TolB-like protein